MRTGGSCSSRIRRVASTCESNNVNDQDDTRCHIAQDIRKLPNRPHHDASENRRAETLQIYLLFGLRAGVPLQTLFADERVQSFLHVFHIAVLQRKQHENKAI